jgi:hypothetical protein
MRFGRVEVGGWVLLGYSAEIMYFAGQGITYIELVFVLVM